MENQENIELKFKELMNYIAAAKHNYREAIDRAIENCNKIMEAM